MSAPEQDHTATSRADGRVTGPASKNEMPQSAAMPSPFPPIADYGFLSNCHTGPHRTRWGDRLALRAALRLPERLRDAARPPGRFPQAFSHLALIEAAGRIILAERTAELG